MDNIVIQMLKEGFTKEDYRGWSFSPKMSEQKGYWSKRVKQEGAYTGEIEIGVIINEKYNTMEVYTCDCHVGCCGRDRGTHTFSIDKINELLQKERDFIIEINN